MKNIGYILSAAALTLLAACAQIREPEYVKGQPDLDGCYGVYFPAQDTKLTLDPSEPTEYTVAVARTNTHDNIEVPYTLTSSSDGIFKAGKILFEDGQSETELLLDFSEAEIGTSYSCSLQIVDGQYASKYSPNPAYLNVSVVREKWNELGKISFSSTYYWEISVPESHEAAALLYQNDIDKNLYRMENPFAKRYTNFAGGSEWFTFHVAQIGDTFFGQKIDRDGLVVYDMFNSGYTNTNYDEKLWLLHPGEFSSLSSLDNWMCNKVLQYQENGLPAAIQIAPYYYLLNAGGGWNATQENGDITIIFPGAVLTDYTFEVEAGITKNGEVPLYFTLGADVASLKYGIYEGNLNKAEVSGHVDAIISGEDESSEVTEDSELAITLDDTGVYTLVAVSFDKDGNAQESGSVNFTYLADTDADKYDVIVTAGLELTSKYESKGHDKTNSVEFYIYGNGLTDVYYGLYTTAAIEKNGMDAVVEDLLSGKPVSAEELETINGDVLSDLFIKLNAQTSYTLVVYASNGYAAKTVTSEITTEGLPLELVGTGTYTYSFWWEGNDPGLSLYLDPNVKATKSYQIHDWGGGISFKYTQDPETGKINVPLQPIGDTHPSYGAVYVMEAKDCYLPSYEGYADLVDSHYDSQKDTAYFCVAYMVSAGVFGDSIETFALDKDNASVAGTLSFASVMNNKPAKVSAITVSRIPQFEKAGIDTGYKTKSASFSVKSRKSYQQRRQLDHESIQNHVRLAE